MRLALSAAVLALTVGGILSNAAGARAEEKRRSLPVIVSWRGTMPLESGKDAPGYVADSKAWEKLWKAWRGDEAVPSVDFREAIILVGVNHDDPNQVFVDSAVVNDKGDLGVTYGQTTARYFGPLKGAYQFALIMRHGIKTFRGEEIGKP